MRVHACIWQVHEGNCSRLIQIAINLAATASNDFMALSSVPLTFSPSSANGAKVCTSLVTTADNRVESEEDFRLLLVQLTSGTSLSLANNSTAVTLIDGDGMFHPTYISSFLN